MNKKIIQIVCFDDVTGNPEGQCNLFLKTLEASQVIAVNTTYNSILGGNAFTVIYSEQRQDES